MNKHTLIKIISAFVICHIVFIANLSSMFYYKPNKSNKTSLQFRPEEFPALPVSRKKNTSSSQSASSLPKSASFKKRKRKNKKKTITPLIEYPEKEQTVSPNGIPESSPSSEVENTQLLDTDLKQSDISASPIISSDIPIQSSKHIQLSHHQKSKLSICKSAEESESETDLDIDSDLPDAEIEIPIFSAEEYCEILKRCDEIFKEKCEEEYNDGDYLITAVQLDSLFDAEEKLILPCPLTDPRIQAKVIIYRAKLLKELGFYRYPSQNMIKILKLWSPEIIEKTSIPFIRTWIQQIGYKITPPSMQKLLFWPDFLKYPHLIPCIVKSAQTLKNLLLSPDYNTQFQSLNEIERQNIVSDFLTIQIQLDPKKLYEQSVTWTSHFFSLEKKSQSVPLEVQWYFTMGCLNSLTEDQFMKMIQYFLGKHTIFSKLGKTKISRLNIYDYYQILKEEKIKVGIIRCLPLIPFRFITSISQKEGFVIRDLFWKF